MNMKSRVITVAVVTALIGWWAPGLCLAEFTNNILLTGYWYPSNEMLAQFSTDPSLNPNGWQGQNWEGRGYDVYAYFPTFPESSPRKGEGDFEVDYQDTSADFWRIVDTVHPVAILSFGQGNGPWEIEYRAINLTFWSPDYLDPYIPNPAPPPPDPNVLENMEPPPPDDSVPANFVRYSTLPVEAIEAAVDSAGIGVNAWVDWNGNAGNFLCGFMFYHDTWYQNLHGDSSDPYWSVAAGFIHVSGNLTMQQSVQATEITLRETIVYVDTVVPEPGTLSLLALGGLALGGLALICRRRAA